MKTRTGRKHDDVSDKVNRSSVLVPLTPNADDAALVHEKTSCTHAHLDVCRVAARWEEEVRRERSINTERQPSRYACITPTTISPIELTIFSGRSVRGNCTAKGAVVSEREAHQERAFILLCPRTE